MQLSGIARKFQIESLESMREWPRNSYRKDLERKSKAATGKRERAKLHVLFKPYAARKPWLGIRHRIQG